MTSVASAFFRPCKPSDESLPKPEKRGGAALATIGSHVFIFGGATRSDMTGDAWRFDGKNWKRMEIKDMTQTAAAGKRNHLAVSGMSATVIMNEIEGVDDVNKIAKIILFGGQDNETSRQSSLMWELTDVLDKDVKAKQLHAIDGPSARNSHGALCLAEGAERKLMIWGGADGEGHRKDGFLYDFANNKWEPLLQTSNESPCAREMFSLTRFGNDAILLGGKTETEVPADLWTFNLLAGWKKSSQTIPFRRMSHTCTGIQPISEDQPKMLAVFGGVEFTEEGAMGFPDSIYIGMVDEANNKEVQIAWTAVSSDLGGKQVWASGRFGHSASAFEKQMLGRKIFAQSVNITHFNTNFLIFEWKKIVCNFCL